MVSRNRKTLSKWTVLGFVGAAAFVLVCLRIIPGNTTKTSIEFGIRLRPYSDIGPETAHFNVVKLDSVAAKPDSTAVKPDFTDVKPDTVKRTAPDELNLSMSVLHELAQRLSEQGRPLIYVAINDAFIPLANSWLCNTMFMGVHDQILVITTDSYTKEYFSKRWPTITVITQPGEPLHGDQEYGRVGYWRLNIKRMNWTLMLLELGVDVFMIEMDSVWFANPIPDLQQLADGVDIVTLQPHDIAPYACAGFVYVRPTEKSINMWKKLLEKMRKYESRMTGMDAWDKTSFKNIKESDQGYLTQLVIREKYGGITHRAAPYNKYPDGGWYDTKKPKNPDVIQNNFVVGNKNKIKRAKKFGHWFVDDVTEKCDVDQVKAMTNGTRNA